VVYDVAVAEAELDDWIDKVGEGRQPHAQKKEDTTSKAPK